MKRIFYLLPMLLICACTGTSNTETKSSEESVVELPPHDLPLPTVPDSLTTPEQRADYLLAHFWDAMDFKDAQMMGDTLLVEQTFSNFIELLPYCSNDDAKRHAVDALLIQAAADPESLMMIEATAQKYLEDTDSPFCNPELYEMFVQQMPDKANK